MEIVGEDFLTGIVIYLGDKVVPFGKNIFAVPLQLLWNATT